MVGYYYADARFDAPAELNAVGRRVADSLAERYPAACALVVDNAALARFTGVAGEGGGVGPSGGGGEGGAPPPPVELFLKDASRGWRRMGGGGASGPRLRVAGGGGGRLAAAFLAALAASAHLALRDYDEHLDDPALDFLNPGLNARLAKA